MEWVWREGPRGSQGLLWRPRLGGQGLLWGFWLGGQSLLLGCWFEVCGPSSVLCWCCGCQLQPGLSEDTWLALGNLSSEEEEDAGPQRLWVVRVGEAVELRTATGDWGCLAWPRAGTGTTLKPLVVVLLPVTLRPVTVGWEARGCREGAVGLWDSGLGPPEALGCLPLRSPTPLAFSTYSLSAEELAAFQKERAAFLAAQKEADLAAAQAEAAKK